jgi:1,4-alpha-glucan branching enzyme
MQIRIHLRTQQADVALILWHSHSYRRHSRRYHPEERDPDGPVFTVDVELSSFHFQFANLAGDPGWERFYGNFLGKEIWCLPDRIDVYPVRPADTRGHVNDFYEKIADLAGAGVFLTETDVEYLREALPPPAGKQPKLRKTMLGASRLKDGSVVFGLFHPSAAQVYLAGNFNDWQCPGHPVPNPERYIPLELYRGYYDNPNIWLVRYTPGSDSNAAKLEYDFFVVGGVPLGENGMPQRYVHDPFTRSYSCDFTKSSSLVVDSSRFQWQCHDWKTPNLAELIIYELNVYGFTEGDSDIPPAEQGKFAGIMRRIRNGYFAELGVNALELMPLSEAPSLQGPTTMGYDPCGFAAIERDFGTPDQFRELVDLAHCNGMTVLMDVVFNHTSNSFNPLWDIINSGNPGGLYFNGTTPWGNRLATEREEIQDYLIDVCKLLLVEYRIDGFRFDATHSSWMSHDFLHRLQYELRGSGFRPECILIVENLPNETDLNRGGWDGFAQWCDPFHDKIKALTREGVYQDWVDDSVRYLGDIFYYCRNFYALHTNNVINYCESHDENSVPFEVGTDGFFLQTDAAQERKARLALMATLVALGQPMLYMGQEFGLYRERNRVQFEWPRDLAGQAFFQWARGLIRLRRRLPGLRMAGSDFVGEGRLSFIIGPWLDDGRDKKVIGWQANPTLEPKEHLVVMLNFEPYDITVGVHFGLPGKWAKLADIDRVNEAFLAGADDSGDPSAIRTDGFFPDFVLPSSSGFVYKWMDY